MPKLRQLIAASCCTATLLLAACGKSESEPKTMLYYSQHLDEAREKVARLEAQVAELERLLDRAQGASAHGGSAPAADRSAGPGWAD